jgi:hypothetical protein
MVIGLLLLAFYLVGLSLLVTNPVRTPGGTIAADAPLGREIQMLAAVTLLAAVLWALHYCGPAAGLKLVGRELWPGLLAGTVLGFVTGLPLRALGPYGIFWFAFGALYLGAIFTILWFARASPHPSGRSTGRHA